MPAAPTHPPPAPPTTVRSILEHDGVASIARVAAGALGLDRVVDHPRIQKSGLVLAGHAHGIVPTRVQILGETELSFLETLDDATRDERVRGLFALGLSLVVVTRGVEPLPELVAHASETDTPLVVAEPRSSATIAALHQALDRLLAPRERRHAVMVEVHGIGILLLGPSGIGKSECALFLVERGHRLVADDQVWLTRLPNNQVTAAPSPLLRHHLEIRGLGILNVRDLFGATSVWDEAVVDLVAELCPWREEEVYERLGLDEQRETLLGVELPKLTIPVRPGRDMAVILEVAARNQLLKAAGHHSAREFARRLSAQLGLQDPTDG
ncbi:MAG TPA: HPr(Ser) kinase/phosphatase [Sandaracinaceae bacterium LLY-WYZ-13_1]|nr:HPr(Ser) kinase/phosphatase [Sandaracinaceae bacterium LLY-WYZ-13_1]